MYCGRTIAQAATAFALATVVLAGPPGCTSSQDIDSRTQALTTNGLSTASLQLQVLTNSCGANQAQQFFKVVNNGTTNIKTSDIKIKFWVDETSSSSVVANINTGGCLTNASGCFHQVSGVTAAVAPFSPACGPDANHQANKEVTISSTDSTLLAPGQSWSNVQVALHLANYANFTPGTSKWFSPCLTSGSYAPDNHFALYYQSTLVCASGIAAPDCRAPHGTQQLTGHRTPAMISAPYVGPVPDSTVIQLTIGLPLRDSDALQSEIRQMSDPSSPKYRQYLTVSGFTAAYAPSTTGYQQLTSWAQAKGFGSRKSFPNRLLLGVSAPASTVERALYINLNYYSRPDGSSFYAPDREPSLDLDTTITPVLYISNLNDLHVPRGHSGSGGSARYRGADFRNAYASCHLDLTGQWQSIGIFGYGGFSMSDIRRYFNLPATQVLNITTMNRTLGAEIEMTSDIEMALSMAPNAAIVVFEGTRAESDTMLGLMATTEPLSLQLSSSWDWGYTPNSKTLMAEFQAQGQSFFQASGDWGKYPDEGWSADLAGSTIVGGTQLSTNDPAGDPSGYYDHETCWPLSGGWVANGPTAGIDPVAIPDYQLGITSTNQEVSGTYRNLPDVAMVATEIEISFQDTEHVWWGTSASTPLWAGFTALINEESAANGLGPVGFANPVLYAIGKSAVYGDMFNDVDDSLGTCRNDTVVANSCDWDQNCTLTGDVGYHTVAGYDLVTGLGSPKCAMIDQLASSSPAPNRHVAVGGYHACAVRSDGYTVSCWGDNSYGQLGTGNSSPPASPVTPVAVSGLPSGNGVQVVAIGAGYRHTCAVFSSDSDPRHNSMYCWGANANGQFGNGNPVSLSGAVVVPGFQGALAVTAGSAHTCAIMSDPSGGTARTVKCAGLNDLGQLGNGTRTDSSTPVSVLSNSAWNNLVWSIAAGGKHTLAVVGNDKHVEFWGQVVPHSLVQYLSPGLPYLPPDGHDNSLTGITAIAASDLENCAVVGATGRVECWGAGDGGALGDGGGSNPSPRDWPDPDFPVLSCSGSSPLSGAIGVAVGGGVVPGFACALMSDATVQCWGVENGQPCATPVQFLTGVTEMFSGVVNSCTLSPKGISCWNDGQVPATVHFF